MSSTDLELQACGTLVKPGPYGRVVRLLFGVFCLSFVADLWTLQQLVEASGTPVSRLLNGLLIGLLLVNYVVNIGFSRAWKKWPSIVSLLYFAALAAAAYALESARWWSVLAGSLYVWELAIFTLLGTAFVLSAVLASSGCEMRAYHHLYTLLTGTPTQEHRCPIGPLSAIDAWEARRGRS